MPRSPAKRSISIYGFQKTKIMEMDLGTALIGSSALAILAIPFIIDMRNRKREKRFLFQSMQYAAQQHNAKLSEHEFCGDFVLGVDENINFVFFSKLKNEELISQYIDLSEVTACTVVKRTRTSKINRERVYTTERIDFCFSRTGKLKGDINFELYDEALNVNLSGELQFAEEWSKKLNDRLKRNRPKVLLSDLDACA